PVILSVAKDPIIHASSSCRGPSQAQDDSPGDTKKALPLPQQNLTQQHQSHLRRPTPDILPSPPKLILVTKRPLRPRHSNIHQPHRLVILVASGPRVPGQGNAIGRAKLPPHSLRHLPSSLLAHRPVLLQSIVPNPKQSLLNLTRVRDNTPAERVAKSRNAAKPRPHLPARQALRHRNRTLPILQHLQNRLLQVRVVVPIHRVAKNGADLPIHLLHHPLSLLPSRSVRR